MERGEIEEQARPWFTHCRRCRHPLRTPESRRVGLGPRCAMLLELTPQEAEQLRLLETPRVVPPSPKGWARFWIVG